MKVCNPQGTRRMTRATSSGARAKRGKKVSDVGGGKEPKEAKQRQLNRVGQEKRGPKKLLGL